MIGLFCARWLVARSRRLSSFAQGPFVTASLQTYIWVFPDDGTMRNQRDETCSDRSLFPIGPVRRKRQIVTIGLLSLNHGCPLVNRFCPSPFRNSPPSNHRDFSRSGCAQPACRVECQESRHHAFPARRLQSPTSRLSNVACTWRTGSSALSPPARRMNPPTTATSTPASRNKILLSHFDLLQFFVERNGAALIII